MAFKIILASLAFLYVVTTISGLSLKEESSIQEEPEIRGIVKETKIAEKKVDLNTEVEGGEAGKEDAIDGEEDEEQVTDNEEEPKDDNKDKLQNIETEYNRLVKKYEAGKKIFKFVNPRPCGPSNKLSVAAIDIPQCQYLRFRRQKMHMCKLQKGKEASINIATKILANVDASTIKVDIHGIIMYMALPFPGYAAEEQCTGDTVICPLKKDDKHAVFKVKINVPSIIPFSRVEAKISIKDGKGQLLQCFKVMLAF